MHETMHLFAHALFLLLAGTVNLSWAADSLPSGVRDVPSAVQVVWPGGHRAEQAIVENQSEILLGP